MVKSRRKARIDCLRPFSLLPPSGFGAEPHSKSCRRHTSYFTSLYSQPYRFSVQLTYSIFHLLFSYIIYIKSPIHIKRSSRLICIKSPIHIKRSSCLICIKYTTILIFISLNSQLYLFSVLFIQFFISLTFGANTSIKKAWVFPPRL